MHGQGLNPTLWPGKVVVNGNVVDRALTMFIDFSKIRSNVISNGGGNVIATDAVGTRVDEDGAPDSTEIVTNVIAGNLICLHNSPGGADRRQRRLAEHGGRQQDRGVRGALT